MLRLLVTPVIQALDHQHPQDHLDRAWSAARASWSWDSAGRRSAFTTSKSSSSSSSSIELG